MPVTPIESNVGTIVQGKQAALGTKLASNAAGLRRLRLREGGLKPIKEIGYEPYVDGSAFPDPTPYVTRLGGEVGDITSQGQIETAGFCFAQLIGVDVVTGGSDPWTHTSSTGNLIGGYQTIYQEMGVANKLTMSFWDALVSKSVWRVGQDQMVAHLTQSIRAMQAGAWSTTSPTAADSATDPYLWSEVTGFATIDAVAYGEINGETLEVDRKLDDYMGDDVRPCCFVPTAGEITRSLATIVSNNTIPILKAALYNTASPTDGLAVDKTIKHVALGTKYVRSASRSIEFQTPKVVVDLGDLDLAPSPDGGAKNLTFGGRCRPSGGTALTVISKSGDSVAWV
jgi:hypothetical protein